MLKRSKSPERKQKKKSWRKSSAAVKYEERKQDYERSKNLKKSFCYQQYVVDFYWFLREKKKKQTKKP